MSKFVTESQVAETYQVSVRTVRRLISASTLTAYRIGPRMIRLDAEVERVMLANRHSRRFKGCPWCRSTIPRTRTATDNHRMTRFLSNSLSTQPPTAQGSCDGYWMRMPPCSPCTSMCPSATSRSGVASYR